MKPAVSVVAFLFLLVFIPQVGLSATSLYLDVPAIPGSGAPQKYPTATQIDSFAWTAKGNNFQVSRITDSNSPIFQNYVITGNVLHNVSALFYKAPDEKHDPYLTFTFGNTLVSAISFTGAGSLEKENIQFNYDTRKIMYLKIPGVPGAASPPGYDNVLFLNSFTFDSSGLTLNRNLDSASPALSAGMANGTDFGTASLLFYDLPVGANSPVDPPYDIMNLSDLTVAAYQTIAGPASTTEQVTFNYSDFNEAPEPGAQWLLGVGISALALRRPARCAR